MHDILITRFVLSLMTIPYASVYYFVVTFFSVRRKLQSLLHWHCALVPDWISRGWECFWLNFQVCNTDNLKRKYTAMYTVLTCWYEFGFIVHSYTRAQLQKLWCYKGLCGLDHIMHVRSFIHQSTVTMSSCSRFYGNQCYKIDAIFDILLLCADRIQSRIYSVSVVYYAITCISSAWCLNFGYISSIQFSCVSCVSFSCFSVFLCQQNLSMVGLY